MSLRIKGGKKMKTNVFYHGDCLFVMRHDIPEESIDLIYLDPPFFTGKIQKSKNHNKACEEHDWNPGAMQISYDDSKRFWKEKGIHEQAPEWLKHIALQRPDFASYLYYMMERLQECYRVLKPTGSIYLHCDWRASHYLKMIMDEIFGYEKFQREIIWDTSPLNIAGFKTQARNWIRAHDTIFFYTKDRNLDNCTFNKQWKDRYKKEDYIKKYYKYRDEKGIYRLKGNKKIYLNEDKGEPVSDVWKDILSFNYVVAARQSVGYPTQKPEALLERIIKASSNEGDIVLDPFCGCGTTVVVAHKLNREWIGIDINNVAIEVIKKRCSQLKLDKPLKYSIVERTLEGVKEIINSKSKTKGLEFENWVNEFFSAKKPTDKGIDGITPDGIPIQVKTYKINDTIVNGFYGQALMHRDVPKPLKVIRLVSGEGYTESAMQAKFEIESKWNVKVELLTPEDLLKLKK